MFSPVVIIILSALKCVLYSPIFAYRCHPIRSGPPFFILMDIGQQKLFMCFPQFDSIGCWRLVQRQPRQRLMAANKKGLQMVQRRDHHQIFCAFATLIICVKTLLLVTGITFVTSTNIAASFLKSCGTKSALVDGVCLLAGCTSH